MRETVTDKTLCQLILNGLLRSFESTIQTITHQHIALTFDQISASFITESHRRESRTIQPGDEEALAATYNQRNYTTYPRGGYQNFRGRSGRSNFRGYRGNLGRGPFNPTRPPQVCYNCGQLNHIACYCRAPPKEGSQSSGNQPSNYANVANFYDAAVSEDYGHDSWYNYGNGPWYMDSGTSGHIVSDSSNFHQTQHLPGSQIREIRTGGGESHSVVSTGTSTVRTDSREIKLSNVKYMPSMKKNLISVGSIADKGNSVIFDAAKCWIIDK